MSLYLGPLPLDPAATAVREEQEEIGGRDARIVTITGVVVADRAEAVEARLDAVMAAAAGTGNVVALELRPGRRLLARRREFKREVARDGHTGTFTLTLAAEDPFEEAAAETFAQWEIAADGDAVALVTAGNAPAPLSFELTAASTLVSPTLTSGASTLRYDGLLVAGDVLCFDGSRATATLNGAEVTPYVTGTPLWVPPEGANLTYSAGPGGGHTASVLLRWRDRWW